MTERTFTMDDMIASVLDKQPQTFKDAFGELMAQKAAQSVMAKKEEVAKSVFASQEADTDGEPAAAGDDVPGDEDPVDTDAEEQQPNETEDENVDQT
jgi:hypothetical protein